MKVKTDDFAEVILQILKDNEKVTYDAVNTAADKTARETVKKIKAKAPVKTGKYRANWGSKVTMRQSTRYGKIIYNRKRYRLAHLLQHGHGGPRPAGPHPHIPSDEETAVLFEQNLKKEMSK